MDSPDSMGDMLVFYVGQHESNRPLPVSDQLVRHAQDCGYDMLTTPITTPHFHARVLTLLTSYNQAIAESSLPASTQPLPLVPALDHLDTPLAPSDTISQFIAFTSPWIDLASPDPLIAYLSRQVFNLEIAYAAFCGVVTVVVQGPRLSHSHNGLSQFARAIREALQVGGYIQLHVLLPMDGSHQIDDDEDMGNLARFARPEFVKQSASPAQSLDPFSGWTAWNAIRSICRYHSRLSLALDLPRRLPSLALQSRWYSEPLRLLNIPASSFLVNARGSYVLSKPHQLFIFRCMRLRSAPWLLLSDIGPIPGVNNPDMIMDYPGPLSPALAADASSPRSSMSSSPTPAEAAQMPKHAGKKNRNDPTPHLSYIRYLQRNQPVRSMIERFGGGFQDYLQSPLQPLTDNLESITYEVFEKDPIKYEWYERATEHALRDWVSEGKSTSSENGSVVIAVVGAGRGPLVTRALKASEVSGVPVQVFAIEKNPNAYVLLQRHNIETWGGRVTIVKTDMRAWKGPSLPDGTFGKVDILVSELLGSFADNELSPECLDGVQHVLNADHGISIPASYTAHLTPISSPRLYADLLSRSNMADSNAFDIPWVVMFQQIDYLSTLPPSPDASHAANGTKVNQLKVDMPLVPNVQTAWEFSHPLPPTILAQSSLRRGGSAVGGGGGFTGGDGANEHNVRFSKTTFPIQEQGVCHGLGGYFETVLYSGSEGKVELSTNPVTMEEKSKDMISWFPILFPLKAPLHVPANSELEVSMWRQTDDRKVWYEWLIESFITINDRRVRLGISDLHSSRSNGCLM
ncbi:protein arginine N-methyltransferase HSL7 [Lindgomyces ingoldianus]|uniref:Protein arginine N-methyltransferase HSL7 n=1 Tax=Lindgomyces ingoldianus TaxID=673940 RepID=A0ACB6QB74_9PLEO|nr:protein arginine N-methyltransferase HSL7 [Lindgomyces ingoldianus]KAF2463401.1 protein arginine N-methyltransferase HSL7 [Lindgomyces ingoldianus]